MRGFAPRQFKTTLEKCTKVSFVHAAVVAVYFFPSDTFSTKNEVRLASKLVRKRLTK